MKFTKCFLLIALPIFVSPAQGEEGTNSIPKKFNISRERSKEERIQFFINVGQSYATEEDIKSAIEAYERVFAIEPDHLETKARIAHLYTTDKQYRKAEAAFLALLKEYPDNFTFWNNLAWLYATSEDPSFRNGEKAIKFAHEALTLAPKDHHVWSTLAEAYYLLEEYEKSHRAILHMASLPVRRGADISDQSIIKYREQILKCKRAMDTAKSMKKDED